MLNNEIIVMFDRIKAINNKSLCQIKLNFATYANNFFLLLYQMRRTKFYQIKINYYNPNSQYYYVIFI